jgi:hypothetical protein
MPGMTTLPAVLDTASDLSANEFEVGYITGDGTRHPVICPELSGQRICG